LLKSSQSISNKLENKVKKDN